MGHHVTSKAAKRWLSAFEDKPIGVVVKIMVPFWIPIIIRHPIFRVPKKGPYF